METRKINEPPKSNSSEEGSVVEKAAYDPGWNDPPLMSYESASGPVKKGILNKPKRIAFPLDSSQSPSGLASSQKNVPNSSGPPHPPLFSPLQMPVPPPGMPPICSGLPSVTKSGPIFISKENSAASITSPSGENTLEKEPLLESVLDVFDNILDTFIETKDVAEIKKRLGVMTQMWKSNKLDIKVQQQLSLLACAIENGRVAEADEIHKSLVVNYTSQCSSWMAGVRKLVQHASSKSTSTTQNTVDGAQTATADNIDGVLLARTQNMPEASKITL